MERLDNLLRHISNVRESCELLGERLILAGEEKMGIQLIANGNIHDNSKFYGIEWEFLNDGARPENDPQKELFLAAVKQHRLTNLHHAEHWNGIENCPELYLAEMVCDWRARANERSTDLIEWIRDVGTKRYDFSTKSRTYRDIKKYTTILLDKKW